MQMPRWNRRFRIMLDWTIALLFRNDVAKLDLFGSHHPTVADTPLPTSSNARGSP
jgi:hypothetical protein